jgi:aminoglycoside phosphotransferase family enzyme/predicted kinase
MNTDRRVPDLPSALTSAVRRRASPDGAAPVDLRSTHASWVFIGEHDVWKVKRPVSLGFLDFSTLDARRRFCEAEVSLNRRLAPEVYLGVEPVRRGDDGLVIGGPTTGPVVDWAVHMRRLPDEASAAALLARGELTPGALASLAARMARFHDAARVTPSWGSPSALWANVDENFAQSERFVGDLLDRATFEEARAFQTNWLEENEPLTQSRAQSGRVREGHGDLRLEHVYFLPDPGGITRPVVIDCLEFAERYRCADVACDLGFLAMELELARRPDLAAGFLARYAEASDDFELYRVIDFYLSYRAWVRGKVAALVADDVDAPTPLRQGKRVEAQRQFGLARSYAGRALDTPFVLAVGGMIGSGKSTLAEALGRELGAPVISSDRTRKVLAGLSPTERGGAELYTDASRARVYDEIVRRAAAVVESGRPVVLDATFSTPHQRAMALRLAGGGVPVVFFEVTCDPQILRERLGRRRRAGGSVSDATDLELDELTRRYQPPGPVEGAALVRIDSAAPPEHVAERALRALAAHRITRAFDRRVF